MMFARFKLSAWLALACLAPILALAQEATIRKNLSERLANLPKIDEISKTPMNGLYELRMGNDCLLYTSPSPRD